MRERDECLKVIRRISAEGLLINPEALDILKSEKDEKILSEIVERSIKLAKEESTKMIEERHVLLALSVVRSVKAAKTGISKVRPLGMEYEAEVKVLYSPSPDSCVSDSMESKVKHFRSRFEKISSMIRRRPDFNSVYTTREVLRNPGPGPFKMIVMIVRKGKSSLVVEDLEGEAIVTVPRNSPKQVLETFRDAVTDIVVGVEVRKYGEGLILTDILFPQVPDAPARKIAEPISTLLFSDLHVGSKYFMVDGFQKLIEWLSGTKWSPSSSSVAISTKYLIIAGDLVDGVFVYPGQEKELEIIEVEKQYEKTAQILAKIPEHIHLILMPGNHDNVRRGLPQPPISSEHLKELAEERGNVTMVGNPAEISLHGLRFLFFHGQSLEDVALNVARVEYSKPERGLEYLLSVRHLAPIYGDNTQIALTETDELVITDKPDVFHAGHLHVFGMSDYRGTRVVNSGTWQEQTPYQMGLRMVPTPGTFAAYLMNSARMLPLRLENIVSV